MKIMIGKRFENTVSTEILSVLLEPRNIFKDAKKTKSRLEFKG